MGRARRTTDDLHEVANVLYSSDWRRCAGKERMVYETLSDLCSPWVYLSESHGCKHSRMRHKGESSCAEVAAALSLAVTYIECVVVERKSDSQLAFFVWCGHLEELRVETRHVAV